MCGHPGISYRTSAINTRDFLTFPGVLLHFFVCEVLERMLSSLLYALVILSYATNMSALEMKGKIGFVGIGIMGKGMVKNLATKLPSDLVIWNRSNDVCKEVMAQYPEGKVTIANTPADVVRQCEVTFCMLSTPEASEAVFDLPGDGVIDGVIE